VGESSFWYRPTRVVPDQRPLNGRCCCCSVEQVVLIDSFPGISTLESFCYDNVHCYFSFTMLALQTVQSQFLFMQIIAVN